jgi:tetratricopeptide (TPR) repeat protein
MSHADKTAPDLDAVLSEAHALVERRRFAQARGIIARGLEHYPDNSELQYLGAFIEYAQDDNETAMRSVRQVLAKDPEHYGARKLSAHLHADLKEFPQAEAVWISLLQEYPEDADCYAAYAQLMLTTLNVDKAGRLAQEGLRHSPDHSTCLYVATLVDLIHGRGGKSTQNANLQRLLHEHPEHVQSSIALVIALSSRGENGSALRVAQELLRNQPDSEDLVNLVRELRMQSHWSMLPLYPMQRWGWTGAVVVTILGIVGVRALANAAPGPTTAALSYLWLAYVIYSWVWPSMLRKLLG